MKRTKIILSVLLSHSIMVGAQVIKTGEFGISLGMGQLQKQDLIFSPYIARDWSPMNILLEYSHRGKIEQQASLRYGQYSYFVGEPFSYYSRDIEYAKYPHSFSNLELNYSLTTVLHQSSKWTISAGGRIRNRFQISNYEFGHAGQFSYNLSSGLDVLAQLEYRSGSHTIKSSFAIPLFSYQARSPYTGQDDNYLERIKGHGDLKIFAEHIKSGSIQSWNTSQMMDIKLRYNYSLNAKWDVGLSYLFVMNRHSSPVQYTSFENIFFLGTSIKF